MNYWLIKSEPIKYPWEKLLTDKKTCWDGVRNYQARNNLKAMKKGDLCLFYHSNEGKEIVGIAKVVNEYYQDPTTTDTNWVAVDVASLKTLKKTVSIAQLKENISFAQMEFLRQSRLSVSSVQEGEFEMILYLSDTKLNGRKNII